MSALGDQNPIDQPQLWDVVTISGVPSPGVIKDGSIGDWSRQYEWDVKKGKGTQGATETYTNAPPAEGSITWYLWTAEQFAAWNDFLPNFKFDPTKSQPEAISIYHPALDALDISSVVVKKIGSIQHEGKNLYSITIDFLEYFPTPNVAATGTPSGSTSPSTPNPNPNPSGSDPPNAPTAEEKEIAALAAKAAAP